jgi:AcrR family transcriptional regulator
VRSTKRRYELKARAERQAQTRQRITEATVALHEEVGPARTTVAEVARRAGVQRLTVYNHFPDEGELLGACSAHFLSQHPPPDPTPWGEIEDPSERLRQALGALYPWYRETEAMSANVLRDAQLVPALCELLSHTREAQLAALRELLGRGWNARGARRAKLDAAIALALSFWTWQTLARDGGLTDDQAAEVSVAAVSGLARRPSS